MGARRIMWYFGFVLWIVQVPTLESAFISKEGVFVRNTHFDQVKSSKDIADNDIYRKDHRRDPLHPTKAKIDINLDELIANNGTDTIDGIRAESNSIDPDEYHLCDDGNTLCPDGYKCCVDADEDGVMECCILGESVSIEYK